MANILNPQIRIENPTILRWIGFHPASGAPCMSVTLSLRWWFRCVRSRLRRLFT